MPDEPTKRVPFSPPAAAALAALLALAACDTRGGVEPVDTPLSVRVPTRYVDRVFTGIDLRLGVPFGLVMRSGGPRKLVMDVFMPAGDTAAERAVLVLAHDGGFVSGTRHNPLILDMAFDFALRGYVTATIDYRLLEAPVTSLDAAHIAVLQSVHDLKAAVRFFREDAAGANLFRADIDAIFAGGISAGAAVAAMAGVLDPTDTFSPGVAAFLAQNGGIDGNSSSNTQFASDVAGVFAVSGAVVDLGLVDNNSAPLYAAHEQFDFVVPCGTAPVNFGGYPMVVSGSCDLVPALQSFSVPTGLFFKAGAVSHLGYTLADWKVMDNGAASFLAGLIP